LSVFGMKELPHFGHTRILSINNSTKAAALQSGQYTPGKNVPSLSEHHITKRGPSSNLLIKLEYTHRTPIQFVPFGVLRVSGPRVHGCTFSMASSVARASCESCAVFNCFIPVNKNTSSGLKICRRRRCTSSALTTWTAKESRALGKHHPSASSRRRALTMTGSVTDCNGSRDIMTIVASK